MSQDAEFDRLSDLLEKALLKISMTEKPMPEVMQLEWYSEWRQALVENKLKLLMESADEFLKLADLELGLDFFEISREISEQENVLNYEKAFRNLLECRLGGKYRENPSLKHLEIYLPALLENDLGL